MRVAPKVAVVYLPKLTDLCGINVGDATFSKDKRLRKPTEFNHVYQHNQQRVKGQYVVVLAFSRFQTVANDSADDTIPTLVTLGRLGVVVSKKISKLAVRRNRLKRLIREQFRQNVKLHGWDFVVIAKPTADQASNAQITKELNYLWKKLHKRCAIY